MPVGIGYDVHRFSAGRRLILGGVEFPSDEGLLGHSDADVAIHALMDAVLGAAGLGDIGMHFPPSDVRYAGASSVDLLRDVITLVEKRSLRVGNVDLTIIAERPRIGPRSGEMRVVLANVLRVDESRVNIKSTTNEGLGFIGRGEGIAAIAVVELLQDTSNVDVLSPPDS